MSNLLGNIAYNYIKSNIEFKVAFYRQSQLIKSIFTGQPVDIEKVVQYRQKCTMQTWETVHNIQKLVKKVNYLLKCIKEYMQPPMKKRLNNIRNISINEIGGTAKVIPISSKLKNKANVR